MLKDSGDIPKQGEEWSYAPGKRERENEEEETECDADEAGGKENL